MKRILILAAILALILIPVVAMAHNAGHIFLPNGACLEIGSFREAPSVGPDGEQLDLLPDTPRDEFGVSFVGVDKDTPIFPGPCPAQAPPQPEPAKK